MNYENWGAGAYGSDGYNEGFGGGEAPLPGGYTPSGQTMNEDFSPGTQEVRIRAPKPALDEGMVNQTRSLLGLGAPPAMARPVKAKPAWVPPIRTEILVALGLAGVIGLGYWYWKKK